MNNNITLFEELLAGFGYLGVGLLRVLSYVPLKYFPELVLISVGVFVVGRWRRGRSLVSIWIVVLPILFYTIFRTDVIVGTVYSSIACKKLTHTKIFKQVILKSDHWDSDDWPTYITRDRKAQFVEGALDGRYKIVDEYSTRYWAVRVRYSIIDTVTGEALAQVDSFRPQTGWYWRNVNVPVKGTLSLCGEWGPKVQARYTQGGPDNRFNLVNLVFVKKDNSQN